MESKFKKRETFENFRSITICSFVINFTIWFTPYFHIDQEYDVFCKENKISHKCIHSRENLTSFLGSLKGSGEKHEGFAGWKMSIQVPCLQNFRFSYEKKFLLVLSGLQMFTHKLLGRSLYRLELEAFTSASTMLVSISSSLLEVVVFFTHRFSRVLVPTSLFRLRVHSIPL